MSNPISSPMVFHNYKVFKYTLAGRPPTLPVLTVSLQVGLNSLWIMQVTGHGNSTLLKG